MSFAEAFDMGRHATYVWGSYGVTALCIVAEIVWLLTRRRTILARVGRIVRMAKRQVHEAQT